MTDTVLIKFQEYSNEQKQNKIIHSSMQFNILNQESLTFEFTDPYNSGAVHSSGGKKVHFSVTSNWNLVFSFNIGNKLC